MYVYQSDQKSSVNSYFTMCSTNDLSNMFFNDLIFCLFLNNTTKMVHHCEIPTSARA